MNKLIEIDGEILGGIPVFAGTRVPVRNLLDYIENNQTVSEFKEDFPTVSSRQINAFLELAFANLARQAA